MFIVFPDFAQSLLYIFGSIAIPLWIYYLHKRDNIRRRKARFYNKAYHDMSNGRIKKIPCKAEDMTKVIEAAKYILYHRSECKSDEIWDEIKEAVHCIANGTLMPAEEEWDKTIDDGTEQRIHDQSILIIQTMSSMKDKYE